MADTKNPSRAERAVSNAKKKSLPDNVVPPKKKSGTAKKSEPEKKTTASKKAPAVKTEYQHGIPYNAAIALGSLGLFLLFIVICINPDGFLPRIIHSFVLGMIGPAGFYFSIPALLYLFAINTFGRKAALGMRNTCTLLFVLMCGCIYHLAVQDQGMAEGFAVFSDLYRGGMEGFSGGILCGGVALILRWACGNVLAFIVAVFVAVIMLLCAFQITPLSLYKAIANRPRPDWDEEEDAEKPYMEPAAVVVNHIANKNIEQKRKRREAQLAAKEQKPVPAAPVPQADPMTAKTRVVPNTPKAEPVQPEIPQEAVDANIPAPSRGKNILSTIGMDSEAPLAERSKPAPQKPAAAVPVTPSRGVLVEGEDVESIPRGMPKLERRPVSVPPVPVAAPVEPTQRPAVQQEPIRRSEPRSEPKPEPRSEAKAEPKPGKVTSKDAAESALEVADEIAKNQTSEKPRYCFPPIDLLKRPSRGGADGTEEMRENSRRLNETLASFKIDAHIINVTRGPSVTRYEVELDKGVRLNKLTGCADDIALSLGASGVRIAAVPGKISVVGIEVPNRAVTTVSLREVIDSPEFARSKSKSSFSVGKDIGGSCIIGNIAKMPHMLIAGTTGSGKSVCMNSIIISLLYKAGPEDVKLIMVDPKMVELGIYNGIPHLLIPVVTDPKKAAGSLQWAVTEMLRRYKMMSDMGVRDLESYNSIVTAEEGGQKLPQVVIIIDELADLMMVAAKEVEDSICRIAQMGRAAGMHLIIATQRPSADVITGLMKANIPSRIAFSVASAMESRIILDTMGAEKLVGKGDMLYAPIGCGKPLRVQGCFVTDSEVESVANYVKDNYVADYDKQVLEEIEKKAQQTGKKMPTPTASDPDPSDEELEGDEMLPAAVDVILETGQASVSMLQRRLKLGYARAARIVDEMEEKGIVGPFQGSKPRSILITKEQWQARKNGETEQMDFDDLEEDYDAVPEELM